jgi:hypothetical protein
MNPATSKQAKLVAPDVLRLLADGLDTPKLDEFLDAMFDLATTWRSISCAVIDDRRIRVQADDAIIQEAEIERAKTKLRMACARLAVRCSEWLGRPVSPYGDTIEVEHPRIRRLCKVHFENTTDSQMFRIDESATNGL